MIVRCLLTNPAIRSDDVGNGRAGQEEDEGGGDNDGDDTVMVLHPRARSVPTVGQVALAARMRNKLLP